MLPKPDFSSLDKNTSSAESNECTVNKNTKQSSETFRCIPCDQVFVDGNDLIVHEEEHIPCGFAGCEFEANYKVLLDHQTSVHMNLKKRCTYSLESSEDIEKWRAERRRRFPKAANTQKELSGSNQMEPANSNECLDKRMSVSSGLPTGEDGLRETVEGEECKKQCLNDSSKEREAESCSPRKRGPINSCGRSEGKRRNERGGKKKRRNQRKKQRDDNDGEADERKDARWQSNSTPQSKSGGNCGSTLTTKACASGFMRRPTLFEKLMQSSVLTAQSKDGDNE